MVYYYKHFYHFLKFIGYFPALQKYVGLGKFGWIYSVLILLILSFPSISTAVQFGMERKQILISSFCFYTIIPVNYILGIIYIQKPHFNSIIIDSKRSLRDKLPTQAKLLIGIIISGLILAAINVAIWLHTDQAYNPESFPVGFDYLISNILGNQDQINQKNVIITMMLMYWIYGWLILITNLSIFCLIFRKHLHDIIELKEYIEDDLIWKMDQTSFTNLTRKIISLRFVINQSVDALENFYTITTILGAIAIGPVVETKQVDPYLIYHIIKYLLLQAIFLYFLYKIPKSREDILKIIKSPTVMFKYLTNIKSMQNVQALREAAAAATTQEEINNINSCKIAAYSPVSMDRLNTIKRNQIVNLIDEAENGLPPPLPPTADDLTFENLENSPAELELLTLGYKNNAAIDWMILQGVLSEKWASFNLLGVSFDNTDVIKKGVGVISLIILASSYLNSLSLV